MKELRTTKQNRMVEAIAEMHHDHPTADELYLEVRAVDNHISRGTVYRNLEKLCETGHLLRIKVPGADRYDSRLEYHYHIVCNTCGKIYDAPIAYRDEIDRQLVERTDFQITRHRTVFEGTCPACAQKSDRAVAEAKQET